MKFQLSWPPAIQFMLLHGKMPSREKQICGRPTYVRGFVFYFRWMGELFQHNRFFNLVGAMFPALFGARCIMCVACGQFVMLSALPQFIWKTTRNILDLMNPEWNVESENAFLYEGEDIERLPDNLKQKIGATCEEAEEGCAS